MFGMSQCCDQWRSQTPPEVLSMSEVGIPYRVIQCVIQTAEGVQQNMEEHAGNYVQSGLHRPKSVSFLLITLMVSDTQQ